MSLSSKPKPTSINQATALKPTPLGQNTAHVSDHHTLKHVQQVSDVPTRMTDSYHVQLPRTYVIVIMYVHDSYHVQT